MMRAGRALAAVLLVAASTMAGAKQGAFAGQGDTGRYERATRLLYGNTIPLVLNARVRPRWRTGTRERFTYRRELTDGRSTFVEVDAATGNKTAAFDPAIVATGLTRATGTPVDPSRLPFADYDEVPGAIRFGFKGDVWQCARTEPSCADTNLPAPSLSTIASPDGHWLAYVEDGNLWVRSTDGKERFALTHDAEPRYGYAVETDVIVAENCLGPFTTPKGEGTNRIGPPVGSPLPPGVLWSPDSKRLLTHRLDQRRVRDVSITQSAPTDGSVGPITWTYKYAMPGDPVVPMAEHWIFDLASRTGRKVDMAPVPVLYTTPVTSEHAMWSPDSRTVRMITTDRFAKTMALTLIDAASATAHPLITETSATNLEPASLIDSAQARYLANGDVVWFSERSGYGHLYLYDGRTGALKKALTGGAWTVRNLLRVDEPNGLVYVAGTGRSARDDPYYRRIYSVRLNDGKVTLLTPEDADHLVTSVQQGSRFYRPPATERGTQETVGFSPSGKYFVDSISRPDMPTRTVLRRADGTIKADVETADARQLAALGVALPERFETIGADGRTKIYGTIWRPSNFDPNKRYPVLETVFMGPMLSRTGPAFVDTVIDPYQARSFAELGTIVVAIDGRGTAFRSKRFQDFSYGRLGSAELLEDHVAALKKLGRTYPYMDLDRVGIVGFEAFNAMTNYPDFYKMGISDAAYHDLRSYIAGYGDRYVGKDTGDNYDRVASHLHANALKGKLLLLHGEMDSNVLPYQSMKLADALLRANADYEFLEVPNMGHITLAFPGNHQKRAWEFLVNNLIQPAAVQPSRTPPPDTVQTAPGKPH